MIQDTEMVFDAYDDEACKSIDPRCESSRIAARRIEIVAMLDVDVTNLGKISMGKLRG